MLRKLAYVRVILIGPNKQKYDLIADISFHICAIFGVIVTIII